MQINVHSRTKGWSIPDLRDQHRSILPKSIRIQETIFNEKHIRSLIDSFGPCLQFDSIYINAELPRDFKYIEQLSLRTKSFEIFIERIIDEGDEINYERLNSHSITTYLKISSHLRLKQSLIRRLLMIFINIKSLDYECGNDVEGEEDAQIKQMKLPYLTQISSKFT